MPPTIAAASSDVFATKLLTSASFRSVLIPVFLLFGGASAAFAQATVRGTVTDPLGKPVNDAKVTLQKGDTASGNATTNASGAYSIPVSSEGRYRLLAEGPGFATYTGPEVYVAGSGETTIDVLMQISSLRQDVVVSATGSEIPVSQIGASITLIRGEDIQAQNKLDVLENLRQVPGAQVIQNGQRGGNSSFFIRGGESSFNKIMIDGAPANSIGGGFDFAQLSNTGVGSIEILRGPNSVLFGSDALAGVVNITTRRGTSELPHLTLSSDGGNFGTHTEAASLGGAYKRFDYFSAFSRFDTRGSVANSFFHNGSYAGNFGFKPDTKTDLRVTYRKNWTGSGSANSILLYGIPDDSLQKNQNDALTGAVNHQTTERWHNLFRFAFSSLNSQYINPSQTGIPSASGDGLGRVMTIQGANGYSVTGQGILDFCCSYPVRSNIYTARRSAYAQTDYRLFSDWTATFGFRYEHENGSGFIRNNYSYFMEAHGSILRRLYATVGTGIENNAVFGVVATPRVSLAYYLRQPSGTAFFSDTKLHANFGKGIKEMSTFQQGSQLYSVLTPEQRAQYNVSAVGPERSRAFDAGIEQGLFQGRVRVDLTYFNNRFYDLISYLSVNQLKAIGVPAGAADATGFGAYVNASSNKAQGFEATFTSDLGHGLRLQGGYTYLDAVTTKAFGDPATNPLFPGIQIGQYAPLVGNRPFRRAPHTGNLALTYSHRKFTGTFSGYLVSRRDDSTFLSDPNYGNSMLLPNQNLAPAYQKFDASANYRVTRFLSLYTSIENLFSKHYQAAFGFPALPFAIRSGLTITLGGEEWRK